MSRLLSKAKRAAEGQLFFSPAKVNVFLRVLGKRADGFHEISSLFQAIDLGDEITVIPSSFDQFSTSLSSLPMDESNLVVKALALFRKKTGNSQCFHIHLDKKIPLQAGLGGGSSNAATTLWALANSTGNNLSQEELLELSQELGSDVSFFFSSGVAHVSGRGERLEDLPYGNFLPSFFWIAKPSFGLATAAVYQAFTSSTTQNSSLFYNDLEEPAFSLEPSLKRLKKELLQMGFEQVVMSGSGSAFFCLGEVSSPTYEGVEFFKVHPLKRASTQWYKQRNAHA
jgi:4-diphosphocytidyl-2-C-methyl-D-erythritol kinase